MVKTRLPWPVTGLLVSELILDGRTSLDIKSFRYSRFADGTWGKDRALV